MVQEGHSQTKSNLTSLICALLHSRLNSAKLVKNDSYLLIFYKHYSTSKFDVLEIVQVGSSLVKSQSSLHSFVHFCTPA